MNERQIFEGALEISDPVRRRAFLDAACGPDLALRNRLDALLTQHADASRFLEVAAIEQVGGTELPQGDRTILQPSPKGDADSDGEVPLAPDLSFLQPSQKPGSIGTLGHYEILQVLGQGAFGIVFKAFDEKLHRHVAIKAMNPQLAATSPPRKRFLREARSVAAIKHENIVQVYSVEEQPLPYLVMEYIDGPTLQQKLDGAGPLDVAEILHLGRQMAVGLAAAHEKGLIHRDIKPGNILLESGAEQKVKITDFGLARAADDATMTRTGTIAGTPMYMAPEQALGQTLDARADLFSLGSVLYQMTSGRAPFRGATALAVLKRVIDETPRSIQDIIPEAPGWLCQIIAKLHAKRPEDRFNSAKEVADLLARCQAEWQLTGTVESVSGLPVPAAEAATSTSAAPTPSAVPETSPRSPRKKAVLALVGVLLLAIGGFLYPTLRLQLAGRASFKNLTRDGDTHIEFLQNDQVVGQQVGYGQVELPAGDYDVRLRKPVASLRIDNAIVTRRNWLYQTDTVTFDSPPQILTIKAGERIEFMVTYTKSPEDAATPEIATADEDGGPADAPPLAAITVPVATRKPDAAKPFVLVRAGKDHRSYKGLDGVLAELKPDDVIEMRANGPIPIAGQVVLNKTIDLRAAEGYRPRLELQGIVQLIGGSLRITGCDVFGNKPGHDLLGGSGHTPGDAGLWEFHQCRFLQKGGIDYLGGPGMKFKDSLVISTYGLRVPSESTCSLENCVLVAGSYAFTGQGATFHLRQSTVDAGYLVPLPEGDGKVKFDVEECLFRVNFIPTGEELWQRGMPKGIEWNGKNNCYSATPVRSADNQVVASGLAAWETYLGRKEPGASVADWPEFRFDIIQADEESVDKALAFYGQRVELARTSSDMHDLGPNVSLMGPGEAYVRALAAAGKPVAEEDLRPEFLAGGPFTLLHTGASARGFADLQAAVNAAQEGDVIEIRSDADFTAHAIEGTTKLLTIRGAAGYLPVCVGGIHIEGLEQVTIENLCVRDGYLGISSFDDTKKMFRTKGSLARLTNCAFLSGMSVASRVAGLDGATAEFVNCIGGIHAGLQRDATLSVTNCAGGPLRLDVEDASACTLRIDRCYWYSNWTGSPSASLFLTSSDERDDSLKVHVTHTAHDALCDSQINLFGRSDQTFQWQGERNLYRSMWSFATLASGKAQSTDSRFVLSLADWQALWNSDADSVEQPPRAFDPGSWRLLSNSVGYRTVDGRDCGADVDRILTSISVMQTNTPDRSFP